MNNKVEKEKLEVINLIKKTFLNFKFNLKETLVFEMFYRLLALFILWPINYVIIKYFMKSSGFTSISNSQFIDFALSIRGIICIGVVVVISFCMIFFEIGALTYIGVKSHNGEKVRLLDGAFNSFSMLKDTMDRGMIPLVLITGVIGPLTGIGLCSSLIRNFTIPPFITIELKKTLGGKALLFIGIAILVILLFRWCL
ncbi:glycerophosphoryl diester phosphodiesterase membrane domain-containing protein, partial [Clostridium chrysemydis]